MAQSQAHKLGEFLGSFFEYLMKEPIQEFSEKYGLFFDSMGVRKTRKGKKVCWTDIHDSKHDLDFVLEKGGSQTLVGDPVAFIELAWRRYTKHSKNKVQEISGAVDPICEKYKTMTPFKGAILCGFFTENSLEQLKNDDFHVLYIPFEKFARSFKNHGLDIDFDEKTKESEFKKKFSAVSKRSNRKKLELIRADFLHNCNEEIKQFVRELDLYYNRRIKNISVLPLHGVRTEVLDIDNAIAFIKDYSALPVEQKLEYIDIVVTYINGSMIQCQFKSKEESIAFLEKIR